VVTVRRRVRAAIAVLALAGCASTGRYFDDSRLTSNAKTALIGEGTAGRPTAWCGPPAS
jgi:hypothetical protein